MNQSYDKQQYHTIKTAYPARLLRENSAIQ